MDGKRLRELRKDKNITQQQLATMLDVDLSTIGKWEIHNATPNKDLLLKLADYFNVTTDYLLGRDDVSKQQSIELDGVYLRLAKEAQERGLTPNDVRKIISLYEAFKKEDNE